MATTGFAYQHGATIFWSATRHQIKHHHWNARSNDRLQWGTSQSPSPLKKCSLEEALRQGEVFNLTNP